jgi:hypothetical protein
MASSRAVIHIQSDTQLVNTRAFRSPAFHRVSVVPNAPPNPISSHEKLAEMRLDKLRMAVRKNEVSFPSQVPTFPKHTRPDLQRKLVQLYFILGWRAKEICTRYHLGRSRFQQILGTWTRRAIELGYIQRIPPDQKIVLPSSAASVRVVLSVVNGFSAPVEPQAQPSQANRPKSPGSFRPRSICDARQIATILTQLETGRTVPEMAEEAGVTPGTIRAWRRQKGLWSLRNENARLKERLAALGAN